MSNGNTIKSPVETTTKIRAYVKNLCENLDTLTEYDQATLIDVAALLDSIHKIAEEKVKEVKSSLDFEDNPEIEGTIGRARKQDSEVAEIDARTYRQNVSENDFFKSIKVVMKKAKEILSEDLYQQLRVVIETQTKVSLQLKIK